MGMKKYVFGEAGVIHLVSGMVSIFLAIAIIFFTYGGILGKSAGDQIVIAMTPKEFASTMLTIWLGILFFGAVGGFEIGRYVQTEFNKRRKST